MSIEKTFSLTGENSHTVKLDLGQGSFSIGTIGMNPKYFDVLVDESLPINWDTFNTHFTGHGAQNKTEYPFGDWPRFIYYYGNDIGFTKWTEKRKTEDFTWVPQKSLSADFSKSQIRRLSIHSNGHKLSLKLWKETLSPYQYLHLSGDLESIEILQGDKLSTLSLGLNKDVISIPKFDAIKEVDSLDVSANVIGEPFDCKSLLQFKEAKHLSLSGNVTNLEVLSEFKNLESLALRKMMNLEGLPELKSWKSLKSFICIDCEEGKGKLLRKELNALKKEREMNYSSVSQLRKPIWYTTEYGIPFSNWGKNEKKAVNIYKKTVKLLNKAENKAEIKQIIIDFTKQFNAFEPMETTEREDVFEAILQLIQVPNIEIDKADAEKWFDSVRDY